MMALLCMMILFAIAQPTHQVLYSCKPSTVCGCSLNSASVSRIVGGEDAKPSTWSWTVSLNVDDGRICGGSIISGSWIITAAHCVKDYTSTPITVYVGSNLLWNGTQSRQVSRIIVHEDYIADTFVNDIALLEVVPPLNMADPNARKICMPSVSKKLLRSREWPAVQTDVVAVGWGRLAYEGETPTKLQQVGLQTVGYQEEKCARELNNKTVQFCASVPGGAKDTCKGDSGGPLMTFVSNNVWVLAGLTSYGHECALPEYAGIYTRVAAFEDWIKSYVKDANWIVFTSHANTVSLSLTCLIFSITFIFVFTFHLTSEFQTNTWH